MPSTASLRLRLRRQIAKPPAGVFIGYRLPLPLALCSRESPSSGGGFRNLPRHSSGDGCAVRSPSCLCYFMCSLHRALRSRRRHMRRPARGGPRPRACGLGGPPPLLASPARYTRAPRRGSGLRESGVPRYARGVFIGWRFGGVHAGWVLRPRVPRACGVLRFGRAVCCAGLSAVAPLRTRRSRRFARR